MQILFKFAFYSKVISNSSSFNAKTLYSNIKQTFFHSYPFSGEQLAITEGADWENYLRYVLLRLFRNKSIAKFCNVKTNGISSMFGLDSPKETLTSI